jgi:predicted DNA-binding protein
MKNQDKMLTLKISAELLEKLSKEAKEDERTVSSMVRVILSDYFKNKNSDK